MKGVEYIFLGTVVVVVALFLMSPEFQNFQYRFEIAPPFSLEFVKGLTERMYYASSSLVKIGNDSDLSVEDKLTKSLSNALVLFSGALVVAFVFIFFLFYTLWYTFAQWVCRLLNSFSL